MEENILGDIDSSIGRKTLVALMGRRITQENTLFGMIIKLVVVIWS
jgi:hypothetical protein